MLSAPYMRSMMQSLSQSPDLAVQVNCIWYSNMCIKLKKDKTHKLNIGLWRMGQFLMLIPVSLKLLHTYF